MILEMSLPEILIERMQYEDLKEVMEIEEEAFPDPWHESFFRRQLDPRRKHMHLYVARLQEKVIGYVVFYLNFGEGHILNIAVGIEQRRRGVGRMLLNFALEFIETNAADVVFLEVSVNNSAALDLYKQFGFEVYGQRRRYYSDGSDAYVLRKHVVQEAASIHF